MGDMGYMGDMGGLVMPLVFPLKLLKPPEEILGDIMTEDWTCLRRIGVGVLEMTETVDKVSEAIEYRDGELVEICRWGLIIATGGSCLGSVSESLERRRF
jgi:hypothetical protein